MCNGGWVLYFISWSSVFRQPVNRQEKMIRHVKSDVIRKYRKTWTRLSTGTDVYPHMPILCQHAARFHERRISSVTFTSAHRYGIVCRRVGVACALADSSDFGLLWEQSSQKCEIACLGRRWTAVQNMTPLSLSSAEKSVNVQTNKQTTLNDVSTLCLSTCADNKVKHVV